MKGEENEMKLAGDEPEGMMLWLGVRPMALLKCIYTNGCSMGNKDEEHALVGNSGGRWTVGLDVLQDFFNLNDSTTL